MRAIWYSVGVFFLTTLTHSSLFPVGTGPDSQSLDQGIEDVNLGPEFFLEFTVPVVSLSEQVRPFLTLGDFTFSPQIISVTGFGNTLQGNGQVRGFSVGADGATLVGGNVNMDGVVFRSCVAEGGAGNNGGGGGLGAGGALLILSNTRVGLSNCSFVNSVARGGNGGSGTGVGGGGGLSGNGGFDETSNLGGGGGFGGDALVAGGGCNGFPENGNAQAGGIPGGNFAASRNPADSGVGGAPSGMGNFGGGGGSSGMGGRYGGGGSFSDGGFGGGGGGSTSTNGTGNGGFGAGNGAGSMSGVPGFGGSTASATSGGGGAGFGGAIFIEPGAELTLGGVITFSNNTVVRGSGGTPNTDPITGFGALGCDIFMMTGSTVIFETTNDLELVQPIEGNQGFQSPDPPAITTVGGVIKRGSSMLTLRGDNTFTGTLEVEGGELMLTSSVITDVIIDANGTLSGGFSVNRDPFSNGGNVTNDGTLSIGVTDSTFSTVNVIGDYTQTGNLMIDIGATGVDQLVLTGGGTGTLSGDLTLFVNNGNYVAGTQYTVIDGTTNGTLNLVETGPMAGMVQFAVSEGSLILTVLNDMVFFHQLIFPGAATAVADCITCPCDPIVNGSDFANVVAILGELTDPEVNEALVSLSPVEFGALEWINARNNSYVADLLSRHLLELSCSPRDCCACDCNRSAWITVFGNLMDNFKRFDQLRPFEANAVGALGGFDWCNPCYTLGGSVGYIRTHLIWHDLGGTGNLNTYLGAIYGSYDWCWLTIDASVQGGATEHDLERRIVFGPLDRTARSDPWGYFVTGHLGLRTEWRCGCATFIPFALGDYHYFTRDSFDEKGADSIDLDVRSSSQQIIRAEAGLKWLGNYTNECICFGPYLGLSWVGEFPLERSRQSASFEDRTCRISVTSYDSSVQLASPQAGIKWTWCEGCSFQLGYKGLFNKRTRINEVEGRWEWIF